MLRIATAVLSILFAATGSSQTLTPLPNTGCTDGSGEGLPLFSVGGELPTVPNLDFALSHTCPFGSDGAFFLVGTCNPATPISWPLNAPCFSAWQNPPSTCTIGYDVFLDLVGGSDARQGGKVSVALPIPPDPGSIGMEFCFQFICVNLANGECTGISQGLNVTLG